MCHRRLSSTDLLNPTRFSGAQSAPSPNFSNSADNEENMKFIRIYHAKSHFSLLMLSQPMPAIPCHDDVNSSPISWLDGYLLTRPLVDTTIGRCLCSSQKVKKEHATLGRHPSPFSWWERRVAWDDEWSTTTGENQPVRALVRNVTKANELFSGKYLEIVQADLGYYDSPSSRRYTRDRAVQGCDSIISVSGTMRFSKITDFLPWRLFRTNVTSWCNDDRKHPYFPNYQAQVCLVKLAVKHKITRFVRLTGLTVGLPAFSFVSVLFCGLLSMTSRYNFLAEQYLRQSSVPHVILRPGGLASKERVR